MIQNLLEEKKRQPCGTTAGGEPVYKTAGGAGKATEVREEQETRDDDSQQGDDEGRTARCIPTILLALNR